MASLYAVTLACGVALASGARIKRSRRTNETSSTSRWNVKLLEGKMKIERPAFMMYDEDTDDVVVSQFGYSRPVNWWDPINLPAASSISRLPRTTLAKNFQSQALTSNFGEDEVWVKAGDVKWPNALSKAPGGEYTVIPDGFLPPGKEDGGIYLGDAQGEVFRVTAPVKGDFYHEVEWHDFNGDGLEDMLTSRVHKGGPFYAPKFTGTLVWLENPGKDKWTSGYWKEHIIVDGPDVIFKSKPYKGGLAVFCTEFFGKVPRVSVRLLNTKGEQTDFRIIDTTIGKPFAVHLSDLDGDGHTDLVVTNHQDNKDDVPPGAFVYEIPSDLMTGTFERHQLCSFPGIVKAKSPGVGSPGFAEPFTPRVDAPASEPKHIVIAGDGSLDVWYLRPTGKRFEYESEIIDIGGTTGQMLVMDFDKDGITDVLIPDNDKFNLRALTFEEA